MRISATWVRSFAIGAGMCGLLGGAGRTQFTSGAQTMPGTIPPASQGSDPLRQKSRDESQPLADATERQAKARNDDRQRRLVADTDKLLALATSLHEDVAKTDRNVLSLDVVRRADEIEKLAHNVKERMKG